MTISTNQLQTNSLVTPSNPTSFAPILNDLRSIIAEINGTPSYTPPYKEYVALVTQVGTAAPTATVISNTLGVTPIWSRASLGTYTLTATGLFILNKTVYNTSSYLSNGISSYSYIRTSNDVMTITTANDSELENSIFEVRVYN